MKREDILNDFVYSESGELLRVNQHTKPLRVKSVRYLGSDGYYRIKYRNKTIKEHRLVYIYFYGDVDSEMDHVNGNKLDNRIENLRPVSRSQNQMNRKINKNSSSGEKGVTWSKEFSQWVVRVQANGKRHFLGRFDNIEDAKTQAKKAREELHGDYFRHK